MLYGRIILKCILTKYEVLIDFCHSYHHCTYKLENTFKFISVNNELSWSAGTGRHIVMCTLPGTSAFR